MDDYVGDIEAKFYAATQVMDEARHVEVYKRLLHEKFDLAVSDHAAAQKPAAFVSTHTLTLVSP